MRFAFRVSCGLACALALFTSTSARADSYLGYNWPTIGADSHPSIVFTINPDLSVTTTTNSQPAYDQIEDTYIGVINNSSSTVNSLNVTGPADTFGFDFDGPSSGFGGVSPYDPNGYGGPLGSFSNINGSLSSGTVNFNGGGLAPGANTYFALELDPNTLATGGITGGGVNTPEPASLTLLGLGAVGLIGYARRRRRLAVAA